MLLRVYYIVHVLSVINKTQPGNVMVPVCWGGFQERVAITLQCKVREGVSEEVGLKLKLNDGKEPSMQRFWERQRKL